MKINRSLLLATLAATVAFAADEAPQPQPAASAPAASVSGEKKDLISVDFPNEEVRTVLRNVADLFELNLVVPETLQGRTSIKLRNVTWRQIFDVVLNPLNYTYTEKGNIIEIVSRTSLQQEPTRTEVYILNYARADEILGTISAMIDTGELVKGRIQVDKRNNALVVTERPTRLAEVKPIIEQLDVATSQVMIETKFIEVTNDDEKNIGINWASLSNYRIGTKGAMESVPASLSNIDATTGVRTYTPDAVAGNLANSFGKLINAPQIVSSTFTAAEFGLLLSFLQTESKVRLVSNPTVVTLNNVESSINIGQEYPIPSYTYNTERGNFEISGFTYKPIGIILKVTPQVNMAGFIKLNIEPTVSSIAREVTFGGSTGAVIPVINSRVAKTQVSLKNGYTMGIGGLIESNTTNGKSRVPVLGEIPVLGAAFKSKGHKTQNRNLVIFITAKTLDSATPAVEEIFDAKVTREMGIQKEELPGHRSAGSPFAEMAPAQK